MYRLDVSMPASLRARRRASRSRSLRYGGLTIAAFEAWWVTGAEQSAPASERAGFDDEVPPTRAVNPTPLRLAERAAVSEGGVQQRAHLRIDSFPRDVNAQAAGARSRGA